MKKKIRITFEIGSEDFSNLKYFIDNNQKTGIRVGDNILYLYDCWMPADQISIHPSITKIEMERKDFEEVYNN